MGCSRLLVRAAVALLFLLPLVWMVSAAFYPPGSPLPRGLGLLPPGLSADNFGQVFDLVPFGRFTLNSLFVALLAVPLSLISASWAGMAMARLPEAAQRWLVLLSLALLLVPGIALWTPRFLIYKQLGWLDTVWALIAPAWMGSSSFFVLMFYRAFRRLPAAVYDAAQLDGAGVLQTWALVALPMARPTAVAVGLLCFVVYWGDLLSPLLYLRSERLYTVTVALRTLEQLSRSDWPLLMAAATLAACVPTLLFLAVQRLLPRADNR